MRTIALALSAFLVVSAMYSPRPAYALTQGPPADVAETIAAAPELDGTVVTVEGEAIGESLRAESGYRWVNLLDEATAIGVVMKSEEADRIEQYGEWRRTGDVVRVTGAFHEACPVHGGDLDIHATVVEIVSPGSAIERPVQWWKSVVAAGGLAVSLWLYRSYGRSRRRGAI